LSAEVAEESVGDGDEDNESHSGIAPDALGEEEEREKSELGASWCTDTLNCCTAAWPSPPCSW